MTEPGAPVVAALSGGVDSAVAAALLVAAGRDVIGMTLRLYDARGTQASAGGRCCGPRDIEDARRVCQHLGIPFYVVDLEAEFSRHVVDDFVAAYVAGQTPNPCVKCNQHIKFSPLIARARALGADTVATGHYARIGPAPGGGLRFLRGVDSGKDQAYFLFATPAEALAAIEMPLGALTKEEVRARARDFALPNAAKAESQEICFVPDGDYAGFVEKHALGRRRLPLAGAIVDEDGAEVGRHPGTHRFTVGQRKGLGAAADGSPRYVVRVDADRREVIVGPRQAAESRAFGVRDVRWFGPPPEGPRACTVQVRHRQAPVGCQVALSGELAQVAVATPVIAAPGQAAVFFDGDAVLGGGWIAQDSP